MYNILGIGNMIDFIDKSYWIFKFDEISSKNISDITATKFG